MFSFPFDLIEEVVDLSSNATLASCALVSRDLSELSRSRLYRSMTIHNSRIATAPDDITTTSSHLLRYVRHIKIDFDGSARPSNSPRHDIVPIFQALVHYGNLIALWFNHCAFSDPGAVGYFHYFTPLLQLDSVKYIRASVHSPCLSDVYGSQERIEFLQALFSSRASLYLNYALDKRPFPPSDFPILISHKPLLQTLQINTEFYQEPWEWFTSHVTLSHLRRLSLSLDVYTPKNKQNFTDLCNSLPESLSELSISDIDDVLGDELLSTVAVLVGKFHSLKYLSLHWGTITLWDNVERDLFVKNVTFLMERMSKPSRKRLCRLHLTIFLESRDVDHTTLTKWKTLGQIIASFNSSLQTSLQIEATHLGRDNAQRIESSFLSALPQAHVVFKDGAELFCRGSEEHKRDLKFGWDKE